MCPCRCVGLPQGQEENITSPCILNAGLDKNYLLFFTFFQGTHATVLPDASCNDVHLRALALCLRVIGCRRCNLPPPLHLHWTARPANDFRDSLGLGPNSLGN